MILLDKNKPFYKANLHCHTNLSDGKMTPLEVKERYKENGYSIVAFTDHEIMYDNTALSDDKFLALKGYELATNQRVEAPFEHIKVAHFNFIAKDPSIDYQVGFNKAHDWLHSDEECAKVKELLIGFNRQYNVDDLNKISEAASKNGFLVTYNHPKWSLQQFDDYINLEHLFAFEIVNRGEIVMGCHPNESIYDDMLRAGKRLFCVAADDNHRKLEQDNPWADTCKAWVQIQSEDLSYKSVITALEKGNFYSSTGPEIKHLELVGRKLYVECSPARAIYVTSKHRPVHAHFGEKVGDLVTGCEIELSDFHKDYIRVTVEDKEGKRAFSNAYFDLF
ncbi:MAG: PHP domain-containing protein [Clostridiales bacterium]|nr:PHP domain-containing protein [Clostridiales bacterium]